MLPTANWKKLQVDEVWLNEAGQLIVLGTPPDDQESSDGLELGHNCDAMGCGQCHVLVRAKAEQREYICTTLYPALQPAQRGDGGTG